MFQIALQALKGLGNFIGSLAKGQAKQTPGSRVLQVESRTGNDGYPSLLHQPLGVEIGQEGGQKIGSGGGEGFEAQGLEALLEQILAPTIALAQLLIETRFAGNRQGFGYRRLEGGCGTEAAPLAHSGYGRGQARRGYNPANAPAGGLEALSRSPP